VLLAYINAEFWIAVGKYCAVTQHF